MIQLHIVRRRGLTTEYLVLKRSAQETIYPNVWQVVTGGVEAGESAIDAALREMAEETSLVPLQMWAVPYVASFYSVTRDRVINVPVFAALVEADAEVTLSDEHQDFEWLELEPTIERLVFPTHKEGTSYVYNYILNAKTEIPFPLVFNRLGANGIEVRASIHDA